MITSLVLLAISLHAQVPPAPGRPVDGPEIAGAFPDSDYPQGRANVAQVWEIVKKIGGAPAGLPPPKLFFSAFDPAAQSADWTAWQGGWSAKNPSIYLEWLCSFEGVKKYPEAKPLCGKPDALKVWAAAHPELRKEFPFPRAFRAFHYDGTDRIQIDPGTAYLGATMQGTPNSLLKIGYYVTGHEMMHYVYEANGIPGPEHHCLFVTGSPSPMDRLADALVDAGLAHPMIRFFGVNMEKSLDPCAHKP